MKTNKFIILIAGLLGGIFFSSCKSSEDFEVSESIKYTLFQKYPDATCLEWDMVDGFYVGEFRTNGFHCEAWFDSNANWLMTETTELVYSKNLPEDIIIDFENQGYSKNNVENIYKVEFDKVETRYIIEVETSRDDSFLFYRKKGELFKTEKNWKNRPILIPESILDYIDENHEEETVIIDADMNHSPLSVEVYEKKYKTVCFTTPNEWLGTYWEMTTSEIPNSIIDALFSLTGKKHGDEQFKLVYHASPETNDSNATGTQTFSVSEDEYAKNLAYVFKFDDGTKIYIDELGHEINDANIPL